MDILRCMDMFLITKIPVYLFVQFVCKVTQCACARLVPHEYEGQPDILRMRKTVCIINRQQSNQAFAQNTNHHTNFF